MREIKNISNDARPTERRYHIELPSNTIIIRVNSAPDETDLPTEHLGKCSVRIDVSNLETHRLWSIVYEPGLQLLLGYDDLMIHDYAIFLSERQTASLLRRLQGWNKQTELYLDYYLTQTEGGEI